MAEPLPTYTREEMDAILKRALERQQAKSEEIAHEDLVAAAGEVGIPREEVEAAARDLERENDRQGDAPRPPPRTPLAPPDEARARAVRRLLQRSVTYLGVGFFLFLLARQTGAGWWIWPALGMGLSLFIQASRVLFGDPGAREEQRAERRLSRSERRRLRRQERLADFERKVAIGADALVRVIDEARNAKSRLDADLRRGSAARAETGPRVIVTPPPAVRVDPRASETVERDGDAEAGEGRRNRRG
jgi:hypothetical protein